MPEHQFFRDSPHGCCVKCQACPTCEPDLIAAPCTESNGWIGTDRPLGTLGPDCRDGKHDACDGRALDVATDEIVDCACPHHRDSPS